jgi:hypothetical protein
MNIQKHLLLATERPRFLYEFVVEGVGSFPLDMLRYDSCWPADQETMSYLEARGKRRLMMRSHSSPTPERWASFGWRVMPWR